jgi:hypothetical protein
VVQSLSLFHFTAPESALPIFGCFNIAIGYLIFRSTFLPRTLGVLMALSGIGWLLFLWLEHVQHVGMFIEGLGVLAEAALMLWLLVMGVNVQRWNDQANRG